MNDLFIKTMKKLQENRRIERNSKVLNEEETADFMSVAGPVICKCADDLMLRLREGL